MIKMKLTGIAASVIGLALILGGCGKKDENEQQQSAPPPATAPSAPSESAAPAPATPDQNATPAPEKPSDENAKKPPAS